MAPSQPRHKHSIISPRPLGTHKGPTRVRGPTLIPNLSLQPIIIWNSNKGHFFVCELNVKLSSRRKMLLLHSTHLSSIKAPRQPSTTSSIRKIGLQT